ncbi:hypothetical protein PQX77_011610 [Marasmius sp. AFHP31]|nr:hypothetical protein PQX77_011610 [Marasmius sp. AFHP31]
MAHHLNITSLLRQLVPDCAQSLIGMFGRGFGSKQSDGKFRIEVLLSIHTVAILPPSSTSSLIDIYHTTTHQTANWDVSISRTMEDHTRKLPLVDRPFIRRAIGRFGSAKNALDHLRQLGEPPKSHSVRISSLPSSLEIFIQVLAALAGDVRGTNGARASESAILHIKMEWELNLGPWVKCLLEGVILTEEEPSTPEAFGAIEHTLTLVPPALLLPSKGRDSIDVSAIRQASPEIHQLFLQIWCKVLDMRHHAWLQWSLLLTDYAPPFHECFTPRSLNPIIPKRLYHDNDAIGRLIARHVLTLSESIHKMPVEDLDGVKTFLRCLIHACIKDSPFLSEYATQPTQSQMVVAFASLASRLISKRRSLSVATTSSFECFTSHYIASVAVGHLAEMVKTPVRVGLAIDAGLLKAMFEVYPCLLRLSETYSEAPYMSLVYWLEGFFDQVSRFLVYSPILHQFARVERRIISVEYKSAGEVLKMKSESLYGRWKMATEKANVLKLSRRSLKSRYPHLMCANIEVCPLNPLGKSQSD